MHRYPTLCCYPYGCIKFLCFGFSLCTLAQDSLGEKQLFADIGKATIRFARNIEISNPGQLPVTAVYRAIKSLEHSTALLELNFNQSAALELFFLKSMRIWANAN